MIGPPYKMLLSSWNYFRAAKPNMLASDALANLKNKGANIH